MTHRSSLDPDLEDMRRVGHAAIDRIVEHLASLGDQPVACRGTASEFAKLVDEPLPEDGLGEEDSLRFFFERVVPPMTRVNHPRFHAYIPCPSSFAGALGEILAAGTNPFVGSWLGGATISSLELTVLRWIAETLGYPSDASGILTSGGSMANLVALAAARERFGRETLEGGRVYVSEEGHASMSRAATLLGYSSDAVCRVAVDDRLRMKPDELRRRIGDDRSAGLRPFFVCANAGTTNTGAIDPLADIADLCGQQELWFHVDAAYGGFAAISEKGRALLAGMARASSVTVDPHKWLYVPMGVGCVLMRDGEALERAFSERSDYLQDLPPDEVNFLNRGPELSRPGRVLSVWMLLRSVGRRELARQVDEDFRLARLAAELIRSDDRFELVDEPQLTVVAFRHRANDGETEADRAARDLMLMERTLADGTLMMSTTVTAGRTALRFVVMNHRTTEEDVRRSVATIRELG